MANYTHFNSGNSNSDSRDCNYMTRASFYWTSSDCSYDANQVLCEKEPVLL